MDEEQWVAVFGVWSDGVSRVLGPFGSEREADEWVATAIARRTLGQGVYVVRRVTEQPCHHKPDWCDLMTLIGNRYQVRCVECGVTGVFDGCRLDQFDEFVGWDDTAN